jgi:hypothetical protein
MEKFEDVIVERTPSSEAGEGPGRDFFQAHPLLPLGRFFQNQFSGQ